MSFVLHADWKSRESFAFIFKGHRLLVKNSGKTLRIPTGEEVRQSQLPHSRPLYLGEIGGRACFCAQARADVEPAGNSGFHGVRRLFGTLDETFFKMAALGLQVNNWDQISGYCGNCGARLDLTDNERAKECGACGRIEFPRISPAVIMSVVRDNKILLARSTRIKFSFHSVLAGYVEVGENLEECVQREVFEEVGLGVKNIRYFGSQSWAFSNSLMIAFTAEHDSGEIKVDNNEIREAGWFSCDDLPPLPGWGSIARRLVDSFVERAGKG